MNELVKIAIRNNWPFELKFEIKSDQDTWVDFSDRCKINGQDSLLDIGDIEVSGETDSRNNNTIHTSVQVDNSDGFWITAPSRLPTLYDVDGNEATFTDWYRKDARIRKIYRHPSGSNVRAPVTCNTYVIDGITPGSPLQPAATIQLAGINIKLMEIQAVTVKNGKQWIKQRPISNAIQKILLKTHTSSEINGFDIAKNPEILNQVRAFSGAADFRRVSGATRMPSVNQSGAWQNAEKNEDVCRWLLYDGTNLASDTIYMAVDEELYAYNITDDYVDPITSEDASDLGSGYFIRKLWYSSTENKIVGIAWPTMSGASSVTAKVFTYDTTGGTFTVVKTITNFAASEYCFRGNLAFDIGTVGPNINGENLIVPFEQYVRTIVGGTVTSKSRASLFTGSTGGEADADLPADRAAGYYFIDRIFSGVFWSMGQEGFCIFNDTNNVVVYPKRSSGVDSIYKYDVGTDTESLVYTIPRGSYDTINTLCGCSSDSDDIFVAYIAWVGVGSNDSEVYIDKFNISTDARTNIYDSTGDSTNYYTPLEMQYDASKLVVSLLNRDKFTSGETAKYYLATHLLAAQNSFDNMTAGFENQALRILATTNDDTVFVEANTGTLKKWGETASASTSLDDSNQIGSRGFDFNMASNLIEKNLNSEYAFYGVSSPKYPDVFYETQPLGDYALWKYSKFIFPYRPLYDFTGWSCWQAIQALADFCDYIANYDEDGNFFFRKRPTDGTAEAMFRNDTETDFFIADISLKDLYSELWNYAQITPFVVSLDKI